MFKFRFSKDDDAEETVFEAKKSGIHWIPASKVEVSQSQIEKQYEPIDYAESVIYPGCKLKLIRSERAVLELTDENCSNIIEAEAKHSDLVLSKYEGGLKIWECSYDLGNYIFENNIEFQGKITLDLGCGAGIIGLVALLNNSFVHFQDYNVEVIKAVTIPNVLLNSEDRESALKKCEFFSGDWESFNNLALSDGNEACEYDLIFSSETIYNPDNHKKLYQVFKQRLKQNGVGQAAGCSIVLNRFKMTSMACPWSVLEAIFVNGTLWIRLEDRIHGRILLQATVIAVALFDDSFRFIAGKSYYFGVGGGMRQFQYLIEEDGIFDVEIAWKSREGLQREILKIRRKNS